MSELGWKDFLGGLVRLISARPRIPRSVEDNEMLGTLLNRRSIRTFTDREIDDDSWAAILEAGRLAPSTVNMQTWSFAHFTAARWQEFFGSPIPVQAVRGVMILADTHRVSRALPDFPDAPLTQYTLGVMNASLAAMNMAQTAEALGLGSVMLSETGRTGFYDAEHLAEKLELPRGVVPIMSIVFGHPAGKPPVMPPKLPLSAVAFDGKYRETEQAVIDRWRDEMRAGYQATHGGEKFSAKIAYYNARIDQTESGLRKLVFGGAKPQEPEGDDR